MSPSRRASSAGIGSGSPPTQTTRARLLGAGSGCLPGVRSRVVCQVGGLSGTLPLTFAAKRDLIRQDACHDPVVGPPEANTGRTYVHTV